MAVFNLFSDLLPDPDNKINDAGAVDAAGSIGPGFVSVKFKSNQIIQKSKTISGRGVTASPNSHNWEFDINYNPLTREQFEPVASFLESRMGGLYPFFVILPQYNRPRDNAFNTYCLSNNVTVVSSVAAGSPTVTITGTGITGNPRPGDFLTFTDPNDVNHTKAYKVIRVETNTTYQTGTTAPTAAQRRIHVQPQIVRNLASGAVCNFINPKFRVQQVSDIFEYSLDSDGLYAFSLSVEEIQP